QDLVAYRRRLLAADAFGLVTVLMAWRSGQRLRLRWLLLPIAGALLIWGLFGLTSPDVASPQPYFLLIVATSILVFGIMTLLAKGDGFLAAWSEALPFYATAFFLLTNINYPKSANYNHVICLGIEFSHYFVGELVLVAGVAI